MSKITDKKLLEIYLQGFDDELGGITNPGYLGIERKAYLLGALHALVGDDVSSIDLLTDEEILRLIKTK